MNREIKFRGYNRKNNQWLYGFYLQNRGAHFVCPDEFATGKSWEDYEIDPDTIGQYTGLHDRSGKEIYEGDTVLVSDWTSVYASDYGGTVRFRRGQWVVSYEKYGGEMTPRLFFDSFADRKTTITGNIHELDKEL